MKLQVAIYDGIGDPAGDDALVQRAGLELGFSVLGIHESNGDPGWNIEPGPSFVVGTEDLELVSRGDAAYVMWDTGTDILEVVFTQEDSNGS